MDKYQITFKTWNKLAERYQEKFMDLDLYDDSYDLFCRQIEKPNPAILEIGCGPGNITRYLLAKRPDFNIDAIDIAPNMIRLARENSPAAHFAVMDCRDIDKLTVRFDAIMCGFCLPYLSKEDCSKLIKDSAFLLKPNGILYLSAIEDAYDKSGYESGSSGDQAYVYYHQSEFLSDELDKHGFEVTETMRKRYPKSDTIDQTHLIIIAKKSTPTKRFAD